MRHQINFLKLHFDLFFCELNNQVIDPGIVTDQSPMGYLHNAIPLSTGNSMYFSAQVGIHLIFFHELPEIRLPAFLDI